MSPRRFSQIDSFMTSSITRSFLLLALIGLSMPHRAQAQGTPESAAAAYGAAIKANDWPTAARMMHPAALKQLRDLITPLVASPQGGQMGFQLLGVHSSAELATTPDTVVFATFIRNVMAQQAGLGEALRTATFTPLGHVAGGGDTVFVVSRMTMSVEGVELKTFDVMPFVLLDGQWRGLLKSDFTNMAAMLRKALGVHPS
jgi:hypothetical protein